MSTTGVVPRRLHIWTPTMFTEAIRLRRLWLATMAQDTNHYLSDAQKAAWASYSAWLAHYRLTPADVIHYESLLP